MSTVRPASRCSTCSRLATASTALAAGRLYLVDPLGNLMMSYERGAPVKGLLDDLKKLLNLSHIG